MVDVNICVWLHTYICCVFFESHCVITFEMQKGMCRHLGSSAPVWRCAHDKGRIESSILESHRYHWSRTTSRLRPNCGADCGHEGSGHSKRRSTVCRLQHFDTVWEDYAAATQNEVMDLAAGWNLPCFGYSWASKFRGMEELLACVSKHNVYAEISVCCWCTREVGGDFCCPRGILREGGQAHGRFPGNLASHHEGGGSLQVRDVGEISETIDKSCHGKQVANESGLRWIPTLDRSLHLCCQELGVLGRTSGETGNNLHCKRWKTHDLGKGGSCQHAGVSHGSFGKCQKEFWEWWRRQVCNPTAEEEEEGEETERPGRGQFRHGTSYRCQERRQGEERWWWRSSPVLGKTLHHDAGWKRSLLHFRKRCSQCLSGTLQGHESSCLSVLSWKSSQCRLPSKETKAREGCRKEQLTGSTRVFREEGLQGGQSGGVHSDPAEICLSGALCWLGWFEQSSGSCVWRTGGSFDSTGSTRWMGHQDRGWHDAGGEAGAGSRSQSHGFSLSEFQCGQTSRRTWRCASGQDLGLSGRLGRGDVGGRKLHSQKDDLSGISWFRQRVHFCNGESGGFFCLGCKFYPEVAEECRCGASWTGPVPLWCRFSETHWYSHFSFVDERCARTMQTDQATCSHGRRPCWKSMGSNFGYHGLEDVKGCRVPPGTMLCLGKCFVGVVAFFGRKKIHGGQNLGESQQVSDGASRYDQTGQAHRRDGADRFERWQSQWIEAHQNGSKRGRECQGHWRFEGPPKGSGDIWIFAIGG